MQTGTKVAAGFLLLWVAGMAFFAAFHPNGIQVDGKPAGNPADVLRYLIQQVGGSADDGNSESGPTPT